MHVFGGCSGVSARRRGLAEARVEEIVIVGDDCGGRTALRRVVAGNGDKGKIFILLFLANGVVVVDVFWADGVVVFDVDVVVQ